MMYPHEMTASMEAELTQHGFQALHTAAEVEATMEAAKEGTTLVVVNSVCGCAAAGARPGVLEAVMSSGTKPTRITTVFAGVDTDAVAKARSYFAPFPPSSPAIALFKDGKLVHFIERYQIEGRHPAMIADNLKEAFATYCEANTVLDADHN